MRKLLALILLFVSGVCSSQQYNFISYTVEDGLAQNQVFSIIQDDKGYLWFATAGGLSRFDGSEFVNYSQRDGLFRNQANDLYKDKTGNIWIATIGGVTMYNGNEFVSYGFKKSLSALKVTCIEEDEEGRMWFGTDGGGLVYLDEGDLMYLDVSGGLSHDKVRTMYTDLNGTLWIGTKEGINYVKEDGIYSLVQPELLGTSVSHVVGDGDGNIWVSTFGAGVFHLTDDSVRQITDEDGLIVDWVRQTYLAPNGHVWFASKYGVSEFYNDEHVVNYTDKNGLDFVDIKHIYQDNEGNIWLGTNGKGVLKFSGKAFVNYTREDGMRDHQVMSVVEDDTGNLWFGTFTGGIIKYDRDSFYTYDVENGLSNNTVWSCYYDSKDRLWIGTALGLNKMTPSGIIGFMPDEEEGSLNDGKITSICEDSHGNVWFGTRHGISKYQEDGTFVNYNDKRGFYGTNIRAILEDADGSLWCGAENGVFIFDPQKEESRKVDLGVALDESKVFSVISDQNDRIWLGTDNGLYKQLESGRFEYISLGQDARTNFINFLIADSSVIWVGTNYGIYMVRSDPNEEDLIRSFTNHEGIKNLECNMNAVFRDLKGYFWFGTAGGLVRMDETKIEKTTTHPSRVTLRNIRLFLEKTDWDIYGDINEQSLLPENLKLPYNKNHLTFDFILFNYSNPKGVVYKYKMKGFDEDWSPLTHSPTATYSNLPPGEYTFKVVARTNDGHWSSPTTFSFVIKPPFWNTWWFYTLTVLGVICIGLAIWIWWKSVEKRKRETEQLVYRNRLLALEHQSLNASLNRHFIFNALNSIQYYINRQDRISANKYLSSFAKLIRKNLDSSSSGNNYVTLAEEMERIELYLSLEHMRFRNKFEYEIKYNRQIDTESIMVPAMLLQPFIENSIWHGVLPMEKSGKITLSLEETQSGDIKFIIEDDGVGIDSSLANKLKNAETHDSKGMKITSGRIDLLKTITRKNISLKGPFQITDNEGNSLGTKVEIIIPVNTMDSFQNEETFN